MEQNNNNNTDKKLRQLENQSLPDLSKMDEHWEQMKNILQPEDLLVNKTPNHKPLRWITAVVVAGTFFFLSYEFFTKPGKLISSTEKQPGQTLKNSADTIPINRRIKRGTSSIQDRKDSLLLTPTEEQINKQEFILTGKDKDGKEVKFVGVAKVSPKTGRDTLILTLPKEQVTEQHFFFKGKSADGKEVTFTGIAKKISRVKDTLQIKLPGKETQNTPGNMPKGKPSDLKEKEIALPADTTTKKQAVDKKKALFDFFAQLEKESQSFVISNRRDTVIWGNEGTALFIPANAFRGGESVTITIKEYYSYRDIITNRLTTCADNQLLVSGGMLHISATVNGREIDMEPANSIRWFVPDTTDAIRQMQLFNGIVNEASLDLKNLNQDADTSEIDFSSTINWVLDARYFRRNHFHTNVRVLDLRDEPYKRRSTKNGMVGKFYLSPDAKISKEDLENYLLTKRNYSRVVIKKGTGGWHRTGFLGLGKRYYRLHQEIGDSAWMEISLARRHNLKATDTIVTKNPVKGWYDFYVYDGRKPVQKFDTAFSKNNLNKLANRYSVEIRTLGWINCDRFLKDSRPKVDLIVDLKESANDYCTFLVFEKVKSMMSGSVSGNKIYFRNVPEGEAVTIMSVGVIDGKTVTAKHRTRLSNTVVSELKFEETTPSDFKEKAASLDKP